MSTLRVRKVYSDTVYRPSGNLTPFSPTPCSGPDPSRSDTKCGTRTITGGPVLWDLSVGWEGTLGDLSPYPRGSDSPTSRVLPSITVVLEVFDISR